MLNFDNLQSNLKQTNGTPLKGADLEKLREFFASFIYESNSEIEKERNLVRKHIRIQEAWNTWFERKKLGLSHAKNVCPPKIGWKEPHLDKAKDELLTAIIHARNAPKKGFWAKVKQYGFIGGIGAAITRVFT